MAQESHSIDEQAACRHLLVTLELHLVEFKIFVQGYCFSAFKIAVHHVNTFNENYTSSDIYAHDVKPWEYPYLLKIQKATEVSQIILTRIIRVWLLKNISGSKFKRMRSKIWKTNTRSNSMGKLIWVKMIWPSMTSWWTLHFRGLMFRMSWLSSLRFLIFWLSKMNFDGSLRLELEIIWRVRKFIRSE